MCDTCGCGTKEHDHNHIHVVLPVSGMQCAHCEKKLNDALNKCQGVHAQANASSGEVALILHEDSPNLAEIKAIINRLGFQA